MAQAAALAAVKMHSKTPVVDIHTHVYPPSYISLLQSRSSIPYIRSFPPSPDLRLVILKDEDTESTSRGRPVGPDYYDISKKIEFMDIHGIDISVISLANPWLDFLPAETAAQTAASINEEVNVQCQSHPGRLYFFATLPLSAPTSQILSEITNLSTKSHCRGIILGTTGLGKGLDDEELLPVFSALAEAHLPIFLHPHYGLPSSVWGPRASEYGHVLPLSLGFPLETTIAITRLILSGVFERIPELQIILAHSGGTLPFLAGRIESCIQHDAHLKAAGKLNADRKTIWNVLKTNIYLDAVIYDGVGLKAAIDASGGDRVMFGTDHPFFPPLDGETIWASVETNRIAVRETLGDEGMDGVMGGNAVRVLRLG